MTQSQTQPQDNPQSQPHDDDKAPSRKLKPRHWCMVIAATLLLIYLSGPVIASVFKIGDRWGPKIYPMWLHGNIYIIAWKLTSGGTSKPREHWVFYPTERPWFYGGYSINDEPSWIAEQLMQRKQQK